MKGTILFTAFLLAFFPLLLTAQTAPLGIHYQTIVRNAANTPLASQNVTLLFSIQENGTIVYQERQVNTTSSTGLVGFVIGQGVVQSGDFQSINWGANPKSLTIALETAPNIFEELGTNELASVPYAFFATRSGLATQAEGLAPLGAQTGQVLQWNGQAWIPVNPAGLQGPAGPQGPVGPTGPQGPQGTAGLAGPIGAQGPSGATGPAGAMGPAGATGAPGPVGPTGIAGSPGLPGATGAQGPAGLPGPMGLNGAMGQTGPAGPTGPTGPTGPPGFTTLNGDVQGLSTAATVTKIQGRAVSNVAPQLNQVLQWNGANWAPNAFNGSSFSNCGRANTADAQDRVLISNLVNGCPATAQFSVETSLPQAFELRVAGSADVLGMRVNAQGGNTSNNAATLISKGVANESNGLSIAVNSDNPGSADITGIRIVSGGDEVDLQGDGNNLSQNYGAYIQVKDRANTDYGLYITDANPDDNRAIFTDGDAYARDLYAQRNLRITRSNGHNWAFSVLNNGTLGFFHGINGNYGQLGSFWTFNGTYQVSDQRYKQEILPLTSALSGVLQLEPCSYEYRKDPMRKRTLGFLAQDVATIFPELALSTELQDGQSTMGLNYAAFSAVTVRAIQEQQTIIDEQTQQIAEQQRRLDGLEKELAEIRALLKERK